MMVYRLYWRGEPVPRDRVLAAAPACGELALRSRLMGRSRPLLIAQLIRPDLSYALPVLDQAWVERITRSGLLIHGQEIITRSESIKSRSDRYRQTWWCKPMEQQT